MKKQKYNPSFILIFFSVFFTLAVFFVFSNFANAQELIWEQVENIVGGKQNDEAPYGAVVDNTYLYLVGSDFNTPYTYDSQWRVEKRDKSNGSLVSFKVINFLDSGLTDLAAGVAADDNYLYIIGTRYFGSFNWRIEKRRKSDLIVESYKHANTGEGRAIFLSGDYLYLIGTDAASGEDRWRIEKRDKALNLIWGLTVADDRVEWNDMVTPSSIYVDENYLYAAGSIGTTPNSCWRIEKRQKTDGSLVGGSTGKCGEFVYVASISADQNYLYLAGRDQSGASNDSIWRIEKRRKSDLGIEWFVTSNDPVAYWQEKATAIFADSNYLYISGNSGLEGEGWRLEIRLKSNGNLIFSETSAEHSEFQQGIKNSIAQDGDHIYIAGPDYSPSSDSRWRIEKRTKLKTNVSGFAWSENIGWISFGNISGGTVSYGVDINEAGEFSGQAWSENIGWISFDKAETGTPPVEPYNGSETYVAKVDLETRKVTGWARALSYGSDWDGWIKLSGPDYGIWIDDSVEPAEFMNYTWSATDTYPAVIGWISFNCRNNDWCVASDYKVITTFNFNSPPEKPGVPAEYPEGETWNNCQTEGLSVPTFYWTYSDPESDPQTGYEIRIDNDSDFATQDPEELTYSGGVSTSYIPIPSVWADWMNWDTNYWWVVRVKDDHENWSEWSDANPFKSPLHASPFVDFTHLPQSPIAGTPVDFFDSSICYSYPGNAPYNCKDNCTGLVYLWDFGDGNFSSDCDTTSHAFLQAGPYDVKLSITDNTFPSPEICIKNGDSPVGVLPPLPKWKEITPLMFLKKFFASISNRFKF
ncbi:MAG: PKD domain-containing protein [Candidatus Pacebacteria bacterium]|nr:PKD domain-containing protein [Candidatus Paceibacterota bacterium]